MTGFSDHFGAVAGSYADFRPGYPPELFAWLAAQCAGHELAWDCGAGSGQASVALAAHFARVHATDASADQVAHVEPHPCVEYRVAPAEQSGLPDRSADLVTVAQALHWFDLPAFYAEVRRALKPGGVIAAWTYGVHVTEGDDVNAVVRHFYEHVVGPCWPPERRHVENGYRELPFPFTRIAAPEFTMQVRWPLAQLLGYLGSWSATARYRKLNGSDPLPALRQQLLPLWGDPAQARSVSWPLSLLAGRLD
jgi:SAM-dependent methyltransferase